MGTENWKRFLGGRKESQSLDGVREERGRERDHERSGTSLENVDRRTVEL